jgi:DEAD/DEAH box helicase domain-containing protein
VSPPRNPPAESKSSVGGAPSAGASTATKLTFDDAPWRRSPTGVEAVVDDWLKQGRVRPCLALERLIPAREAALEPVCEALHPALVGALRKRGVEQLYSHQNRALEAAFAGRDVVVATPTSSGKSLCFHLPVLDAIVRDPSSSALYLYPTKALSRDQEHGLHSLIADAGVAVGSMVFDGDTPGDARKAARERARILLTNPDMLHSGILPNHGKWQALFQSLRYVVLDELHSYRGVFGSHMAHVLGRLQRIARFHGSDPQFIAATATIGNPLEHAERLFGRGAERITLVDESGAPSASRRVLLYNPPVIDETLQLRASALKHAVRLAGDLIEARVPSIVFGESRNSVEVMLKYLRERAGHVAGPEAIMAYRGGYLPETRRGIERGLREGQILCVVATNALELGIDIGELDAVISVGYPGSIASLWQRFGRAGRRGGQSIALMVCSSRALDQFLAREPETLLSSGAEEARIDPQNPEIVIQHLKCATFEAPFTLNPPGDKPASIAPAEGEGYLDLGPQLTRDALCYLEDNGLVHERGGRYFWAGDAYPASHVSLRNIGWDNFVIIDQATDKTLAELDWRASHTMLHEQAIYQHDAEQYQVERLDYENHKAYVRKVEPDYFTTALTYRDVEVIEELDSARLDEFELGEMGLGFGEVKVIEKVTGYKKIKFFTHENAGYGDVHLPEMQMHTTSFWLSLPESLVHRVAEREQISRAGVVEGLRAAGQALETVATLALMCEPRDINRTLGNGYDGDGAMPGRNQSQRGDHEPTLFLFDAQPGGVGLAKRIFQRAPELLERTRALIAHCGCTQGCPACIGPFEMGSLPKRVALALLQLRGT